MSLSDLLRPWGALRRARTELDHVRSLLEEAKRDQSSRSASAQEALERWREHWRVTTEIQHWVRRLHGVRQPDLPLPKSPRLVDDPPPPGTKGPACRVCDLAMWVGQAHYCVTVSPLVRSVPPADHAITAKES